MAIWSLINGYGRSVHSVQATTESAPAAGDGIDLTKRHGGGVGSLLPVLRAPAGQTFTGAGYVRGYMYVPQLDRWVRAPRADDDLADLAGLSEGALPTIPIYWSQGRFALVYEGAGLSGGTAPEIDLMATAVGGESI